jgi:hypothetical protein
MDSGVLAGKLSQTRIGNINRINRKPLPGQKNGVASIAGGDIQGTFAGGQLMIVFDNRCRLCGVIFVLKLFIPFKTILPHGFLILAVQISSFLFKTRPLLFN